MKFLSTLAGIVATLALFWVSWLVVVIIAIAIAK